jgi:hypothetical protein
MTVSALLAFACSETGQAIADAVADAIAARDVSYDDSASQIGQTDVQGALEAMNARLEALEADKTALQERLTVAETELAALQGISAQLDTLSTASTAQNDSIDAINTDLETLESAVQNPVCPEDMANSGIGCVELDTVGPYSFGNAQAYCRSLGRRLCSESEMWAGCEAAGGDNFNIGANEWVDDWVSTQALITDTPPPTGSYIVEHASIQWESELCIVATASIALGLVTEALVRCCAPHQIVIPSEDDPAPEPGQ